MSDIVITVWCTLHEIQAPVAKGGHFKWEVRLLSHLEIPGCFPSCSLCLINIPGGMTSFPKRSPPRLQNQSNSKQALALCYSTMVPLWIVEVFEQENECLLVFLVTHITVILLHSRNRKTHLSMFDRLWQTHQYKKICMKEMSQGCNLFVFYDPLYRIAHYSMYYNNKNIILNFFTGQLFDLFIHFNNNTNVIFLTIIMFKIMFAVQ